MERRWQVQEAKAELSSLIRAAETDGPQTITRSGRPVAVVIAQGDFERLIRRERAPAGTLVDFLGTWPGFETPARDRSDAGREVDL